MAKGNMLLGDARGKVGSLVFSRSNGQQVVRAKAERVKNPQTQAQVLQRIILNTVAQAYSAMSEITDHSFEGIKKGQDSMSYFMRNNINAIRQRVGEFVSDPMADWDNIHAFTPIGANYLAPNTYKIAKGSLPAVATIHQRDTYAPNVPFVAILGGKSQFDGKTAATLTYGDVINALGLQRGDQLTLCTMVQPSKGNFLFKFARLILDPTNADGTPAALTSPLFTVAEEGGAVTGINLPSVRNEGTENVTFTVQTVGEQFGIGFAQVGGTQVSAATIVSRQRADGSWLRSDAYMTEITTAAFGLVAPVTSLQEALDDFAEKGFSMGSDWYLNNATK